MVTATLVWFGLFASAGLDSTTPAPKPDLAAYRKAQAHVGRGPDAHVKLALWCEAHGLRAERMKHLAMAVLIDPQNATARGLMGLIAFGGRWQRPESVGETMRADEATAAALAKSNSQRTRMKNTADAHAKLGLWCEQKGLKAEAIAHFTVVTRLKPSRESA